MKKKGWKRGPKTICLNQQTVQAGEAAESVFNQQRQAVSVEGPNLAEKKEKKEKKKKNEGKRNSPFKEESPGNEAAARLPVSKRKKMKEAERI
jgi:hypothetical protein